MRILVADDDGQLASACVPFLSSWGHEVEIARDGLGALRRARAWGPDLVLARVRLVRMDGPLLVAAIRASGDVGTELVLVGSGEDHEARRRVRQVGATFLAEPVALAELGRLVDGIAERRLPISRRARGRLR